jgi:hypothetical protein
MRDERYGFAAFSRQSKRVNKSAMNSRDFAEMDLELHFFFLTDNRRLPQWRISGSVTARHAKRHARNNDVVVVVVGSSAGEIQRCKVQRKFMFARDYGQRM